MLCCDEFLVIIDCSFESACYYQLRQLRTVSRSLTSNAAATLANSFVSSRLDYCSSFYICIPATRLNCLDRVLRSVARLIGRVSKFDHISAYMFIFVLLGKKHR